MSMSHRYVYIKNGDVITQLQRISDSQGAEITSGPDAFIYNFISSIGNNPVFIASRSRRNGVYKNKDIVARLYKASGNTFMKSIWRLLATADLFFRLLFYKPTRILCGTAGSFLWVAYVVSRYYSIPLVFSCHNRLSNQGGFLKRCVLKIDKWCICRCRNVICHGPYLRDDLIANGVSIGNISEFDVGFSDLLMTDSALENSRFSGHEVDNSKKIILFVGRIEEQKGVADLLVACTEIFTTIADACVVYIGKGSALEQLQKSVEKMRLTDKVHFVGYMNHRQIIDIMKHSALVVTPTRAEFPEGRCMSAMEGMVLGLPVVAPNFGPFPYLVQHGYNGMLYEPNSISDLREKIILLLKNDEIYVKVKEGARITGSKLIKPAKTFGEAVDWAFGTK